MTLLPPKLLVIPKCFFLQFFDIDETLARAQKCPSLPLIFRWGTFPHNRRQDIERTRI
jgi:hypothetical protein